MELKLELFKKEPAGWCWDLKSVASVSEAVRKTAHCPWLLLQEVTPATRVKKHFQDDTHTRSGEEANGKQTGLSKSRFPFPAFQVPLQCPSQQSQREWGEETEMWFAEPQLQSRIQEGGLKASRTNKH